MWGNFFLKDAGSQWREFLGALVYVQEVDDTVFLIEVKSFLRVLSYQE